MKLVLAKILWIFLFFTLTIAEFSVCIGICRESEQQALETLKKEAYDPNNILSSWIVGKDCCEWDGVVCHNLTHHVIELQIGVKWNESQVLRISNLEWLSSLLNLKSLQLYDVDLSKATNWLQVTNMLPSLVELFLVDCSLQHIPPLLDHNNFSSLEALDLSGNNFTSPIPKWIFSLSTLVSLDLSYSTFTGPFTEGPVNMTSLRTFVAAGNSFSCPLPRWLFDLHNLETLYLRNSDIEGEVPNLISNLSLITQIDLTRNALSGKLPSVIGKLRKLGSLHISYNLFEGEISESHFTNLTQLRKLGAAANNLTLKVSETWIPPFQAFNIEISGWNLGPQFPTWLQTQKKISLLFISNCGIEGEVPVWFWNLSPYLEALDISHNQLVGEVPNISSRFIDFTSNNFSGPLPQIPTRVEYLELSDNLFSGGLSHFLCEAGNESYKLEFLNLTGNDLFGEIPDCWMNWPKLEVLILGDNNLIGGLPRSIEALSELKSLDFRGNRLTGPLPSSLGNCTNLRKIDLAENEFIAPLPSWLGIRLFQLIILNLRSNKFHGPLPLELCSLKNLQILDLANNTFSGVIPMCIGNLTTMVTGGILGTGIYSGIYYSFNNSIAAGAKESAMVTTKGNMYQYDTTLALVTNMDMSNNNFSGDIPSSLTILVGLRFCNFSKNHLTGRIPDDIGDMKVLESFDLSENQLSGKIPQSLTRLSFLAYLNISYNNLSGKIPLSTQLQSFNSSSFEGNKKLCGPPLLVNCSFGGPISNVDENEEEEEEEEEGIEDEWDGLYISMAIGFVLSFWGVGASLIFKRSWRHAYYRFLDNTWNSLRVKLHI